MRNDRMAAAWLCLTVVAMAPARAQVAPIDGWGWTIIVPSVSQTDILGSRLRDLNEQGRAGAGNAPDTPRTAAPARAVNPRILNYAPSKSRRAENMSAFIAKTKQRDPAGVRNLEELFAGGDVIDRVAPAIAPYGLRIDNVADAYTVWWINAWQASHRKHGTLDKATYAAVRAQAAKALSAAPELASAQDGAKQKFAEALLIQSVLLDAAMDQAKGNPAKLGSLARAAAEGGRGMGLDLAAMDLTTAGFVPAGK